MGGDVGGGRNESVLRSKVAARRRSPLAHEYSVDSGGGCRAAAAHRQSADSCTVTAPTAPSPAISSATQTASPRTRKVQIGAQG